MNGRGGSGWRRFGRWRELLNHPKCGASREGYVIEEIFKEFRPDRAYFWATHQGAELDLLLFKNNRRIGIEIKRTDAPTPTASMRIAQTDLKLDHLAVVYPGSKRYSLGKSVTAVPFVSIVTDGMKATPVAR